MTQYIDTTNWTPDWWALLILGGPFAVPIIYLWARKRVRRIKNVTRRWSNQRRVNRRHGRGWSDVTHYRTGRSPVRLSRKGQL